MKRKVKKQVLIVLIFLLSIISSKCFAVDPSPYGYIVINKSLASEIDSIIIIKDSKQTNFDDIYKIKVMDGVNQYSPDFRLINIRIKLKLKNNTEITSDEMSAFGKENKINIYKVKGQIRIEKEVESFFLKYGRFILIALIIILVTKLPIALLMLRPENKIKFLKQFSLINLAYIFIIIIPYILQIDILSVVMVFLTPIIIILSDEIYITKYYKVNTVFGALIVSLLSNLIFLIAGLILVFFTFII